MIWICATVAIVAYFLGSIPTGYLAGRAKGIDVRTVGSGNIGATNAFRTLGTVPGILVLLIDGLKGWGAVELSGVISALLQPAAKPDPNVIEYLRIVAASCAILGHNYTCWLKFKGGKGIATSAGVLAALVPLALVISLGTWIIVCIWTRYVSVASIAASAILPFGTWIAGYSYRLIIFTALMAVLAIYKHKGNIQRLLHGTENKLGKKSPPTKGAEA
ncbi:MAG TPA: glycerol-3-phosphate 1-O-acyltransferase PlsY [Verrucomicrobiae bacterium]|nr:glycerol-3-phosphate 1-O-acyltransferase PlsY [Verrucomicrobiae bacterium]